MVVTSEKSNNSGWNGLPRRGRTATDDDDQAEQKVLKNGDERERGTGEERKVMIAMLIEELLLPVKRREGEPANGDYRGGSSKER